MACSAPRWPVALTFAPTIPPTVQVAQNVTPEATSISAASPMEAATVLPGGRTSTEDGSYGFSLAWFSFLVTAPL